MNKALHNAKIKKIEVEFFDMRIVNTGNSDGFVLLKDEPYRHFGNYRSLEDAMDAGVLYFMIERPEEFGICIFHRLMQSKTYHEWFKLKNYCEKHNIAIPDCVRQTGGANFSIGTNLKSAFSQYGLP